MIFFIVDFLFTVATGPIYKKQLIHTKYIAIRKYLYIAMYKTVYYWLYAAKLSS